MVTKVGRSAGRHRLRAAAAMLVLICAGCATQSALTAPGGAPVIRDPDHWVSNRHWEILDLPGEDTAVAAVVDSSKDAMFAMHCTKGDRTLDWMLGSTRKSSVSLESHRLTLVFDGGAPLALDWLPDEQDGIWGFGAFTEDPHYWTVVDAVRRGRSVEAIVTANNKEVLRHQFTLAGAGPAMDYALAACGKSAGP